MLLFKHMFLLDPNNVDFFYFFILQEFIQTFNDTMQISVNQQTVRLICGVLIYICGRFLFLFLILQNKEEER